MPHVKTEDNDGKSMSEDVCGQDHCRLLFEIEILHSVYDYHSE